MRGTLARLAVAAAGAVVVAAFVDALRTSDADRPPQRPTARPRVEPLPPCRKDQLELALVILDAPSVVLRHVRGRPCAVPETPVSVRVFSRAGPGVGLLMEPQGVFAGRFGPGFESMVFFRYSPSCDERGPFLAEVRAEPYLARRRIPTLRCGVGAPASVRPG